MLFFVIILYIEIFCDMCKCLHRFKIDKSYRDLKCILFIFFPYRNTELLWSIQNICFNTLCQEFGFQEFGKPRIFIWNHDLVYAQQEVSVEHRSTLKTPISCRSGWGMVNILLYQFIVETPAVYVCTVVPNVYIVQYLYTKSTICWKWKMQHYLIYIVFNFS